MKANAAAALPLKVIACLCMGAVFAPEPVHAGNPFKTIRAKVKQGVQKVKSVPRRVGSAIANGAHNTAQRISQNHNAYPARSTRTIRTTYTVPDSSQPSSGRFDRAAALYAPQYASPSRDETTQGAGSETIVYPTGGSLVDSTNERWIQPGTASTQSMAATASGHRNSTSRYTSLTQNDPVSSFPASSDEPLASPSGRPIERIETSPALRMMPHPELGSDEADQVPSAGETTGQLKVSAPRSSSLASVTTSSTDKKSTTSRADLPFGIPVVGKSGFVNSPWSQSELVDVSGIPSGTRVKCPYTGKHFRVP